ncbi:MAG: tetratricopeptide repeat protein [Candidatus Limisoma sp.]|nr:tetratricopeptide repeat protein [Candidatus Limisoma sp.]
MKRQVKYLAVVAVLFLVLTGCKSTKKNTASTRFYQSFTTRYNVYFNGEQHYLEQIKKMEDDYEDDYSGLVYIHPAEAYSDPKSPQPSADFTRTIEKMQKAIALHSIQKRPKKDRKKMKDPKYREYLKRGEYNPFLHNAWRLMGEAQYLKGDFLASASTFRYIERHFTWLPELVTESKIWQLRCYCALEWSNEAENIATRIKEKELTNKRLRRLYNVAYADYLVKSNRLSDATPYLAEAVRSSGGSQKTRMQFLLGQLYAQTGDNVKAYEAFKAVAGASGAKYRTQFNARIKQSEVYQGTDIEPEVKSLLRMARQDRNKEYLDQLYYAVGNLYLSRRDTTHAIENYILANEKSTRNGVEKAINQITLGGLYYAQFKYDKAQPCYSEGIPNLPADYPNYETLKRRSDVLDELAVYSQNVQLQDSLLRLAALPQPEQVKVIEKIIEELREKEKKEAEEAKKQEYLAEANANANKLQSNTQTYTLNNDKSWYFYNTTTKNAGKAQFQKLWGSRKLEDNWRRLNKSSYAMSDDSSGNYDYDDTKQMTDSLGNPLSDEEVEAIKKEQEKQSHADDPHYVEYYLRQIPATDEDKLNANNIIQEGLFNMAVILKDKLEDPVAAAAAFDELETRYPDNIYRLDAYYNQYLMYMRYGEKDKAEVFRQKIIGEFNDSKYAIALLDDNYIDNLRRMESVQEDMYAQTYDDYLNNRNDAVHSSYEEMMKKFPLSKIMPKFMFLHAMAYVPENNFVAFSETLKEMLNRYPETDITPIASEILKGISKGRQLHSGSGNARGMLWSTRLTNDTTATAGASGGSTPFDPAKTGEHYCLLTYPTDSVSANRLLFEVARHNFTVYTVRDFDIDRQTFGNLGIIIIKGFTNLADVETYGKQLLADKSVGITSQVRPVFISKTNYDLLINERRSLDEYFMFVEGKKFDEVEEAIEAAADKIESGEE